MLITSKLYSRDWFEDVNQYTWDFLCDYGGGQIIIEFLERLVKFRKKLWKISREPCEKVLGRDFSAWKKKDLKKALSVWEGFNFEVFKDRYDELLCDANVSLEGVDELVERIAAWMKLVALDDLGQRTQELEAQGLNVDDNIKEFLERNNKFWLDLNENKNLGNALSVWKGFDSWDFEFSFTKAGGSFEGLDELFTWISEEIWRAEWRAGSALKG